MSSSLLWSHLCPQGLEREGDIVINSSFWRSLRPIVCSGSILYFCDVTRRPGPAPQPRTRGGGLKSRKKENIIIMILHEGAGRQFMFWATDLNVIVRAKLKSAPGRRSDNFLYEGARVGRKKREAGVL